MVNPLGVYAHPNKKYHDAMLEKVYAFYDSVQEVLSYMGRETVDKECDWIRKALFGTSPACLIDRSDWRIKHIKQLDRVMRCKPGWNCGHLIYCPDCLANWRYTHAATIREMKKESPDLRLILRRESFLIPRGVYVSEDGYKRGLLINTNINPVYDLQRNTEWVSWVSPRINEGRRFKDFSADRDSVSDSYDSLILRIWKAIGGPATLENPDKLALYNKQRLDASNCFRSQLSNLNDAIKHNMSKGISDLSTNPLIPELLARATQITKKFRNMPGYIHRVIIVPPSMKDSVVMVRLDTLCLAPRRLYDRLKEEAKEGENDMWKTDKHYRKRYIWDKSRFVWMTCNKITTNCRKIPDDIHELLALLENRFPYTGNWFTRFLPQEFPFYMNCFLQYQYHRTAGVFSRRA